MEAHRPLSLARLPADFKVKIQLPSNVKTRVVLGEVSLRTAEIDPTAPAKILSSTAFTITAGIAQLLNDLANQDTGTFEEEVSDHSGTPTAPEGLQHAMSTLDPTYKRPAPAVGVVMPPQLERNEETHDTVAA